MPQLAQRLGFDLPDTFPGYLEALTHFFQRMLGAILQAEAHLDHTLFARSQGTQHLGGIFLQVDADHRFGRRDRLAIFDEVAKMRILFFPDRSFQRDRFLCDLEHLTNLGHRDVHPACDLLRGGLAAQLLHQLPRSANQLVDGLDHVHRNADGACLISNGARNRLANPPRSVRGELITTPVFELIDRLHQTDVAFLDQIKELQTAVGVLLGDRNHQAKVSLNQLALGLLRVHIALDHLALGALEFGDGNAGLLLQFFQVGLAVLLLAAIFLAQLFALRLVVLLLKRLDLPLEHAHGVDCLVDLVQQPLAFRVGVFQLADNARDFYPLAVHHPSRLAMFPGLRLDVDRLQLFEEQGCFFLVLKQSVDATDRYTDARLQYLFGDFFLVEDHHFLDVAHAPLEVLAEGDDLANDDGRTGNGLEYPQLPALDALGNFNFAFPGQQWNSAHFAQVHANGVISFLECARCQVEFNVLALLTLALELIRAKLRTAFEHINALGPDGGQQIVEIVR